MRGGVREGGRAGLQLCYRISGGAIIAEPWLASGQRSCAYCLGIVQRRMNCLWRAA